MLSSLPIAVITAIGLFTHTTFAQTWQTVDDFQFLGTNDTYLRAMTKDPFGNVYTVGFAAINSWADTIGVIRKSSDGGTTWSVSDVLSQESDPGYQFLAVVSDAAGTLYAVGNNWWSDSDPLNRWVVRRSIDSGATWSTVTDAFTSGYPPDDSMGAAIDSAGNLYVAAQAYPYWLVRRSMDGGNSWATVDTFNRGHHAAPTSVFFHPSAGIFVCGYGWAYVTNKNKITQQQNGYTRRSVDGGTTWSTIDVSPTGITKSIGADASGNLYAVGQNSGHWTVRKSANGGATWATFDDFQECVTTVTSTRPYRTSTQCYSAYAEAFAADAYGNLFVVGVSPVPFSSASKWIVRSSAGGTGAWQTVEAIGYPNGAGAFAVLGDAMGSVFVGGDGNATTSHWLVRKLSAPAP